MITLSQIETEWKADCKIDITDISGAILKTPNLHSKYIAILSHAKQEILKAERNYIKIRRLRTSYYNGEMDREELDDQGWDQYQFKKPLKTVLDELLQSDEYLIDHKMTMEELTICKDMLESIVKAVASRSYDVRALVEYLKWSQGVV